VSILELGAGLGFGLLLRQRDGSRTPLNSQLYESPSTTRAALQQEDFEVERRIRFLERVESLLVGLFAALSPIICIVFVLLFLGTMHSLPRDGLEDGDLFQVHLKRQEREAPSNFIRAGGAGE